MIPSGARTTLQLVLFIVLAFLCGALLAYPLHRLLSVFTTVPFHKLVSQLTSLFGLLFVLAFLRINDLLSCKTLGLVRTHAPAYREFGTGLGAGIVIMLVLAAVLMLFGTHVPEPGLHLSPGWLLLILVKTLLAGIMVGMIEEILYRGALLGGLSTLTGIPAAVIVSSALYAAVHFIKFPQIADTATIHWASGLTLLSGAFYRFSDPAIFDALLSLLAFGGLLAVMRLINGNIFQCIGLHAGVVMTIKLINEFTDYLPGNRYAFLVNKYDHLLGYLAFAWLFVIIILYCKFALPRIPQHRPPPR